MRSYEAQVYDAVMSGQDVMYTVTPVHDGNRTVPTGFRMTAYGVKPDGTVGLDFDTIVPNTLGTGDNLGMQSENGSPVPTGSTS